MVQKKKKKASAPENSIALIWTPGGCGEGNPKIFFHPATLDFPLLTPLPLRRPPPRPTLHQLIAWARRLVVFYCVLRGPVHRYGPNQAAAADLEEIYEVPDAAVAEDRQRQKNLSAIRLHKQ